MNPPIPLVMRIVILFDWRMEFSLCLIGPKNSHPTQLNGNLFSIFINSKRMRRPLIGAKDCKTFIGQGEQAQGRSWRLTKKRGIVCMWEGKEEEEEV
jgi:hypothetical protein